MLPGLVDDPAEFTARSLVDAFVSQVEVVPDAPAVMGSSETLSYSELARLVFGISHAVADRLPSAPAPVVLLLGQGPLAIAASLGVLAAGAFYVPLDPTGPSHHLRSVIDSVEPRLIITESEYSSVAAGLDVDLILSLKNASALDQSIPAAQAVGPATTAYVYFTSGSTGPPKGVMRTHADVLHNIFRYTTTLDFAPTDRMSLVQSPGLSAVVGTQFGALSCGAALLPADMARRNPADVVTSWLDHGLTIFHAVPALFRFLVEHGLGEVMSLRLVRLEGDRSTSSDVELLRRTFANEPLVVNGLGATECGLIRQFFIRPGDELARGPLSLGHAVAGMDVQVVDKRGNAVDRRVEGEVVVESSDLATAYWRDPDLTAAKFRDRGDGVIRYHTGDIGRLETDGTLTLLGRSDDVVKVRGCAVHLGAIEEVILAQSSITGVRVSVVEDSDAVQLLAEVTCTHGVIDKRAIRAAILERLPAAAVPAIQQVDELPLTAAGKLSRRPAGG